MKSIKEKSEAYDEALKKAKDMLSYKEVRQEDIEYLFPELKESEDERIRKKIIATIHLYYGEPLEDETKEMIAWLEKQPNWCHHKVDLSDCSEEYRKAYYDGWNNCNQQHAQLEAEQKPTEVRTTGYWHVEDVEQKPWSEEDETTKNNISHIIRQYDKISKKENQPCWYIGDCLLWMQNIKDRILPQFTWKPSDGQMKALEHFVRSIGESGYASPYDNDTKLLYSLLFDLKKLMEE